MRFFTLLVLCSRPKDAPALAAADPILDLASTSMSERSVKRAEAKSIAAPGAAPSSAGGGSGDSGRTGGCGERLQGKSNAVPGKLSVVVPGTPGHNDDEQYENPPVEADETLGLRHPPNPVLEALKLASACIEETARFTRDSIVTDRLMYGSALLEHIASGLLNGAVSAAVEREELNRAYNVWRTGKDTIEPSIARDYFVFTTLGVAADYDLKIFISNPYVYAHLQVRMHAT